MMRRVSACAAALGLLTGLAGCGAAPAASAPAAAPGRAAEAKDDRLPLSIRTRQGVRNFHVEVARTEAEQARGLMFRESLAPDAGMIFPMSPPRLASFWMRNTVISLDLVFIRANGTIARIAANAVPYSLDTIDSGEPVAAVLEIGGGRAAALGLAPGDMVRWPG